jgi:hypothetical protein
LIVILLENLIDNFSATTHPLAFFQVAKHFSQRSLTPPLELMRAKLVEMLVALSKIVVALDEIEDI